MEKLTLHEDARSGNCYKIRLTAALLELFKITGGRIAGVEAVFITVPYNMPSPWEG